MASQQVHSLLWLQRCVAQKVKLFTEEAPVRLPQSLGSSLQSQIFVGPHDVDCVDLLILKGEEGAWIDNPALGCPVYINSEGSTLGWIYQQSTIVETSDNTGHLVSQAIGSRRYQDEVVCESKTSHHRVRRELEPDGFAQSCNHLVHNTVE